MKRVWALVGLLVVLTVGGAPDAEAVTEIQWWHAMTAALGEWINDLADGFNKSQTEYKVVAVYKGTYPETMTGAIAAFRAKQHPHIVQVFEVGTATMMAAKGAVKPVHRAHGRGRREVRREGLSARGHRLLHDGRRQDARRSRSTARRRCSTTTRTPSRRPASIPTKPPQTWPEMGEAAKKLQAAGLPVRLHDRVAAVGPARELLGLAQPALRHQGQRLRRARHRAAASTARPRSSTSSSSPSGRRPSSSTTAGGAATAEPKFVNRRVRHVHGLVGRLRRRLQGSEGQVRVRDHACCRTSPTSPGRRRTRSSAGASLWVLAGHKPVEYKGVAKFFSYLSSPEVQAASHQRTGLPADHHRPPTS